MTENKEKQAGLDSSIDKKHIEENIVRNVDEENVHEAINLLKSAHISEIIEILELLPESYRKILINSLDEEFFKEAMLWFPDYMIQETIDIKGHDFIIGLIQELKDAEIPYYIVKSLDSDDKSQILDSLSLYKRKAIEKKLSYPKDSAGRLMRSAFVAVLPDWEITQCVSYIKEIKKNNASDIPDLFNDVFVINDEGIPLGIVSLNKLLLSPSSQKIVEILDDNFKIIHTNVDQEEVALIFRNRGIVTAGVVDDEGILVGVISVDDVLDVIYQEASEDLLLLSGANVENHKQFRKIFSNATRRSKWLLVNFVNALIIPVIVSFYADILESHIIIAALIQFVVALGGNSGMQSLSVTIRGLALKMISRSNFWQQLRREMATGLISGVMIGVLGFCWGIFWGQSVQIGIIAFLAVLVNVMLGVIFGTNIPIILKKLGADPAISSAIFVTILNDVVGFGIVLTIASLILIH